MNRVIVDETGPVTLIGSGKLKKSSLRAAIVHAPVVVAADGAAQIALDLGIMPRAVIGDFDSIEDRTRAAIAAGRQHVIAEQDSTDFEKCLSRIRAPLVIGVGFGGGRVDHHLAAFHAMVRHADRPCLLLDKTDIVFVAPPALDIDLPVGSRFSLFPMAAVAARSRGLQWPVDGIAFAPGARIGTSNRVTGPVALEVDRAGMLVILPASALEPAVAALTRPRASGWPRSRSS
jgi:thiamine pyrophosphokinase